MATEQQGGKRPPVRHDCAREGQTGSDGGRHGCRSYHIYRRRRRGSPRTGQADWLADTDGHDPPGKRTDNKSPLVKDFVPLADLNDIVFTGWDIFEDNVYEAAAHAKVLEKETLEQLKPYLETSSPARGVRSVLCEAPERHACEEGQEQARPSDQVIADIRNFKKTVDRVVVIWCGSTEIFMEPTAVHQTIEAFEKGLETSDIGIAPSQIYAYAALSEGLPFANGAPNLTVDIPALIELSKKNAAPICGKDFKTGQTFMKTVLAPAFKARLLGVSGWYSTNILGNAMAKCWTIRNRSRPRKSRSWVCSITFCSPTSTPISTRTFTTRSASTITHLAATTKRAGTTSTFSAAGLPDADQGRFSLPRFDSGRSDCARSGAVPRSGQAHSFAEVDRHSRVAKLLFEVAADRCGLYPEHDLFIQSMKLKNTLRHIMGEGLITHLGLEYYD